MHDDGPDGHLVLFGRLARLAQGLAHVMGVVGDQNVRLQAQDAVL
jgi:hypothetical protein